MLKLGEASFRPIAIVTHQFFKFFTGVFGNVGSQGTVTLFTDSSYQVKRVAVPIIELVASGIKFFLFSSNRAGVKPGTGW